MTAQKMAWGTASDLVPWFFVVGFANPLLETSEPEDTLRSIQRVMERKYRNNGFLPEEKGQELTYMTVPRWDTGLDELIIVAWNEAADEMVHLEIDRKVNHV
jgi:hypothetical protein